MKTGRDSRSLAMATLVLAVAGPLAFFSGLAVFVLIPRGVPRPILAFFGVATAVTAVALVTYLAIDAKQRSAE